MFLCFFWFVCFFVGRGVGGGGERGGGGGGEYGVKIIRWNFTSVHTGNPCPAD